jgi:hypothetical protein
MKLRVGLFELSAEDDVLHKKLLISSAAKQVDSALSELSATVADYQQKMGDTMLESGTENLKWVFETVQSKKRRVNSINGLLEGRDWGRQVGTDDLGFCHDLDCCRPT